MFRWLWCLDLLYVVICCSLQSLDYLIDFLQCRGPTALSFDLAYEAGAVIAHRVATKACSTFQGFLALLSGGTRTALQALAGGSMSIWFMNIDHWELWDYHWKLSRSSDNPLSPVIQSRKEHALVWLKEHLKPSDIKVVRSGKVRQIPPRRWEVHRSCQCHRQEEVRDAKMVVVSYNLITDPWMQPEETCPLQKLMRCRWCFIIFFQVAWGSPCWVKSIEWLKFPGSTVCTDMYWPLSNMLGWVILVRICRRPFTCFMSSCFTPSSSQHHSSASFC